MTISDLSSAERHLLAIGLVLAGDYLKIEARNPDEEFQATLAVAKTVEKLGLPVEFARACVETAAFGQVLREIRNELRRSTKEK